MKKFRIAIVQYDTHIPDIEANSRLAERLIHEAKAHGADIVLFPECFLTAYAVPDICELLLPVEEILVHPDFISWCDSAIDETNENFTRLCRLAAKLQINLVLTAFSKGIKYPQNTAWIIDRGGNIALKYSKVHTCGFDWERYLEPGGYFPVCRVDGIFVGVMICYDREYPESARELMLGGAELILHPSSCGEKCRQGSTSFPAVPWKIWSGSPWRIHRGAEWAIPVRMTRWYLWTTGLAATRSSSAASSTRRYITPISISTSCVNIARARISENTADQMHTSG